MKPVDLIKHAVNIWAKAQFLYDGPSWKEQPEALAIQEKILAEPRAYHDLLVDLLAHENHLVIAYSIKTLEKMDLIRFTRILLDYLKEVIFIPHMSSHLPLT